MNLPNFCAGLILAAMLTIAQAGRPLASDDASTADSGTCQIEAWTERARSDRAHVLSPACGIAPGLEVGADFTWAGKGQSPVSQAGLALKWVPASGAFKTAIGDVALGLKLAGAWQRPLGQGWEMGQPQILGLLSLQVTPTLVLHANLGATRDSASSAQATLLNLALSWTPSEPLLLFVETQANDRRALLGGTVSSVGARWWMLKDRLGLDLTASREAASGGPTRWALGLGWYGLGL